MKVFRLLFASVIILYAFAGVAIATEFTESYMQLERGKRLSDEFVLKYFGVKIRNEPMAWTVWNVREKFSTTGVKANILIVEIENAVGSDEFLYSFDDNGNLIDELLLSHSANMDGGCNDFSSYLRCDINLFMVKNSCEDGNGIGKIATTIYSVGEGGNIYSNESWICKPFRKYEEASNETLTIQALGYLDATEIRIMRNEIFAAHGYVFKDITLSDYFSQMEWYEPKGNSTQINLSDIEKSNIELIKHYEKIRFE